MTAAQRARGRDLLSGLSGREYNTSFNRCQPTHVINQISVHVAFVDHLFFFSKTEGTIPSRRGRCRAHISPPPLPPSFVTGALLSAYRHLLDQFLTLDLNPTTILQRNPSIRGPPRCGSWLGSSTRTASIARSAREDRSSA